MNRSFTLIELTVVIGIIALLTALILPNYKVGQRQFALQRSTHKLSQDLRRAQEMAMSAKETNGVSPRYGIELEIAAQSYYIFSDANDNGKREPSDPIIERIEIEKKISIDQLFVDDPPISKNKIWITFKSPDPSTGIRGPGDPPGGYSVGAIRLIGGNSTKTIQVNKAGLIYVE